MFKKGDRVVFRSFGEPDLPENPLMPGTLGTVESDEESNSIQGRHVWVKWDDGHRLAMLFESGDRIDVAP